MNGELWDEVIVGGGSSGAVLAARLAARVDRRVLLLEAGPDKVPPDDRPLGHSVLSGANWEYEADLGGRRVPYPMGRVLGGSSAVNAAIALCGTPEDFDAIAAAGNPDWAWARVKPFHRRLEAGIGALPIRRPGPGQIDALAQAFVAGCLSLGLPWLRDLNASGSAGVGPVPSNARGGRRVSTAEAYLAPLGDPPALTVRTECTVSAVLLAGDRAVGVETLTGGRTARIRAGRVTLCAGAIGTPAILQRSGIGPARWSAALAIPPVVDLPGVGANLTDHPAVALWARPRDQADSGALTHAVMARIASAGGDPDLALFLAGNLHGVDLPVLGAVLAGRVAAAVSAVLLTPAGRGRVYLRDADPASPPAIVLRLAAEPVDRARLMSATRTAWTLLRSAPMADLLDRVLVWTERMIDEDALLEAAVRRFVTPLWHPSGTARMGPATDPYAVVDEHCRVHGIAGLQVADASVLPAALRATPNLSCILIAERVAGWMA